MLVNTRKSIQSFVRREGRMSPRQERALIHLWEKYGLDSECVLDLRSETRFCIVEIGFGMGHSLLSMAKENLEHSFIGIEVYRSGIGSLLAGLEEQGLSNVRVFEGDAMAILARSIPQGSVDRLQLFFPDPWPKKRHHKRRLVQANFIDKVASQLKTGGVFHMATDWQPYAEQMLALMTAAPAFINQAGSGQFSERPSYRPLTKYERRGQALGHGVWDLLFMKK